MTDKYKRMTPAERGQADTMVITDCETHRDAKLAAAAWQWKHLSRISDDETNEVTKDTGNKSSAERLDNSDDGRDNNNVHDLHWESPDDNEADTSDPDYEVDESAAA